jgi:hypothetical protein
VWVKNRHLTLNPLSSDLYGRIVRLLVEARKAAGVRQVDIADALQRPQSFVSKYEKRERILDVAEFIVICRLISVDPYKVLKKAESDASSANFTKLD